MRASTVNAAAFDQGVLAVSTPYLHSGGASSFAPRSRCHHSADRSVPPVVDDPVAEPRCAAAGRSSIISFAPRGNRSEPEFANNNSGEKEVVLVVNSYTAASGGAGRSCYVGWEGGGKEETKVDDARCRPRSTR